MTSSSQELTVLENDDDTPHLTAANAERIGRDWTFAPEEHATAELYPRMTNMSAAFLRRAIIRPVTPERPEYVTIDLSTNGLFRIQGVEAYAC